MAHGGAMSRKYFAVFISLGLTIRIDCTELSRRHVMLQWLAAPAFSVLTPGPIAAVDDDLGQWLDPTVREQAIDVANRFLDVSSDPVGLSCRANGRSSVTQRLEFRQGALELSYGVGDDLRPGFRAIVDTGSPFLAVPGGCSSYWGCFDPEARTGRRKERPPANQANARQSTKDSGLADTVEQFVGGEGIVAWRQGIITLLDTEPLRGRQKAAPELNPLHIRCGRPSGSGAQPGDDIIFALFDPKLINSRMGGGGGVFFGLVKYTGEGIRPSLLSQTNVVAFQLRLDTTPVMRNADPDLTLTLSTAPLIPARQRQHVLPLVDLRPYGDTVQHYAARVEYLEINDVVVPLTQPTFALFDSGTTGVLLSDGLVEAYQRGTEGGLPEQRLSNGVGAEVDVSSDLLGDVYRITVGARGQDGEMQFLDASRRRYPGDRAPRSSYNPLFVVAAFRGIRAPNVQVVALGLTFLAGREFTVDIDDKRILLRDC
eukprot:scaffold870_cov268-Pinguiococcus_pyrenoidosus.AAC.87